MRRVAQLVGIKPEFFDEYVEAHAAVWPSVLEKLDECNIRNYSIFHHDGQLFGYFEYLGEDFDADMEKMADDPEIQRWWAYVLPMQTPVESRVAGEWWATMEEVFHH